jgi:hypothetical protein
MLYLSTKHQYFWYFGNRNLSIYAKGLLFDKLSYRAAITNPYRNATSSLNLNSTISTHTPRAQYAGMLTYALADVESILRLIIKEHI